MNMWNHSYVSSPGLSTLDMDAFVHNWTNLKKINAGEVYDLL